jgi:hypothetical protein
MKRNLILAALGASIAIGGLSACSSDSATSPSQTVTDDEQALDMATVIGDASAENVGLFAAGEGSFDATAMVDAPTIASNMDDSAGARWSAANCPFDGGSGFHVCPTVVRGDLTLDRKFRFFDDDAVTELFQAGATDSVNFQSVLEGTISHPRFDDTVSRTRDFTVALRTPTDGKRTWNGLGVFTSHSTSTLDAGSITRSYVVTDSNTVVDVVVAVPRNGGWPLSGTFTHVVHGQRTREAARSVSRSVDFIAVITFNGSAIVPIDIGTRHWCVNIASGRILRDASCR